MYSTFRKSATALSQKKPANPTSAADMLDLNANPITEMEVLSTFKLTKNGEAAGFDTIHTKF